jgi:hypothetical protein
MDLLGLPDDEPILDQLTDVLACTRKKHYITTMLSCPHTENTIKDQVLICSIECTIPKISSKNKRD